MAVTNLGLVGTGTGTSAGTTLAVVNNTGADILAGTFLHICGTWDNIASVTAPTITCATPGVGTPITNHATAIGSGVTTTAGAGIWHQCFRVLLTSDVFNAGTIATLTSNQSAVKRAAHAHGWVGPDTTLRGTVATGTSITGAPSVATTGTALVAGDVVIGSASFENSSQMTADADTLNGPWSAIVGTTTTGGAGATNVGTGSQGKIVTATGAQTYNPTGGVADTVACVYSLIPLPDVAPTARSISLGTVTSTTVRVLWSADLAARPFPTYLVEQSLDGTNFSAASVTNATTSAATVTGLAAPQLYWFRIVESNAVGSATSAVFGPVTVAPLNWKNTIEGTPGVRVDPTNTASGGDPFNATSVNATACSFDNTRAHTGAVSMKMFTSAASSVTYAGWNWVSAPLWYGFRTAYWRGYLYLTAYPASDLRIVHTFSDQVYLTSTGKVKFNAAGTPSTASVALNQWVRLEGVFQSGANLSQVRIFNTTESATPTETITATGTSPNITNFGTDLNTPDGSTFWWDDVAISDVGFIGPYVPPPARFQRVYNYYQTAVSRSNSY